MEASKIEEVRERLERELSRELSPALTVAGDLRALLADHARLAKESASGRITGWRLADGLRVFTASGHTPGAHQEFITLSDHARLQAEASALRDSIAAVIAATRDYLPPDGITKDEVIGRVIEATDNARMAEIVK